MKLIPTIIKEYFCEERKELRRLKKQIKIAHLFNEEFARLEKKKILENLKAEIRASELKAQSDKNQAYTLTNSGVSFGRSLKRGLDSMARNYQHNSKPRGWKHKHQRKYLINTPMGFTLMSMDMRR